LTNDDKTPTAAATATLKSKRMNSIKLVLGVVSFSLIAWLATPQDKLDAATASLARLRNDKVQLCIDYERSLLKDPDSMKVKETEEASYLARIRYTARNELGGHNVATVDCYYDHKSGQVDASRTEEMRELVEGTARLDAYNAKVLEKLRCYDEIVQYRKAYPKSTESDARSALPCWRKVQAYGLD
jgi:hypothetical protein